MIGLLDCNNFFVSCERLFRPDLAGKPVAVLSSNDGCIVARSQEVKDIGVPMGIPLFQARQLVDMSQVTLFSSNFALYRDISSRVMAALTAEVGTCEVYSIDEAFFYVSPRSTVADIKALRQSIMQRTGIPVSIGIAPTKTLAKTASKMAKKSDGVRWLDLEQWQTIAPMYPLQDIWNVGGATARKLREIGVTTVAAFTALNPRQIEQQLGIAGRRLQDELQGSAVYTLGKNSGVLRQSLASTRSFAKSTNVKSALESAITYHVEHIAEKLRAKKLATTMLIIELRASRHGDFSYRKGSVKVILEVPSNATSELLKAACTGVDALYQAGVPYKKAGVVASALVPETYLQMDLFSTTKVSTKNIVDSVVDTINANFGSSTIHRGTLFDNSLKARASLRSPHYTTAWKDIPTARTF